MTSGGALPELIFGDVIHHRLRPSAHRFSYRVFFLRVPLDAIDALPRLGVAVDRFGWITFARRDHGARDGSSLHAWIEEILACQGISGVDSIELICFPRMLGYAFKPVSFWVCRAARGSVRAVVAEVRNTFGEAHNYLLANADGAPLRNGQALRAAKVFHVSPFLAATGGYTFRFHFGPERWLARIDYADTNGLVLTTSLGGVAEPLTRRTLRRARWSFPVQAIATIARIHWNAALLWIKAVPHFAKPEPPARQTTR